MAHHALTYQLGGTIPVRAAFVVTPDGALELTEATLAGQVIDDPGTVGECRAGIWHSLEEILTEVARQQLAIGADLEGEAARPWDLGPPTAKV